MVKVINAKKCFAVALVLMMLATIVFCSKDTAFAAPDTDSKITITVTVKWDGEPVKDIDSLTYDHPMTVSPEIVSSIINADLIILSPGSLYTSTIPHLLTSEVSQVIESTDAPIMYISNLVSQLGETENYTVSDHVRVLDRYLGKRKVDVVIANNGKVDSDISDLYKSKENKKLVKLDPRAVRKLSAEIIADDIIRIDEGSIRHDELKTAYLVFSYLMR